jgi:hypothetical protein
MHEEPARDPAPGLLLLLMGLWCGVAASIVTALA